MAKKRETADVIRGAGMFLGFITDLCHHIARLGGDPNVCIQRLTTPDGLVTLDTVADIMVKGAQTKIVPGHLIVRQVKVNRSRSPQEAIAATGRKQYTNREVVAAMPKGEGDEVEVVFFKPDLSKRDGYISDNDLEKEFELCGLKPADPYSLAAVNEADPAFADTYPNATYWKDKDGHWCFATFNRWRWSGGCEVDVDVDRRGVGWGGHWWFAGLRK